jgi:hypothetical protein
MEWTSYSRPFPRYPDVSHEIPEKATTSCGLWRFRTQIPVMGQLTEKDIFSCLAENFRLAAEDCEKLARLPKKGRAYSSLRDKLELLEGACRQAAYWRQDTRWLRIGLFMEECHKRAGDWLRGIKVEGSPVRVKLAPGHLHPNFIELGKHLRAAEAKAVEFRDKATGKIGTILPEVGRAPHRDTTPVGWRRSQGGLIVPESAAMH